MFNERMHGTDCMRKKKSNVPNTTLNTALKASAL